MLDVKDISLYYGAAQALRGVSISAEPGKVTCVLGRNGVGKTSLLLTLMGITRLHGGDIRWRGGSIAAVPSFKRAQMGLGWVPQERGMFPSLTVEEHLTAVARPDAWNLKRIYELFPRLQERRANLGNQLSGGEQQMVAIARALMTNPALLLLDEPMEGLAPIIVQDLMRVLGRLVREEGMAAIMVEQHARFALSLADRAVILDRGCVVHRGGSRALLDDAALLEGFLGVA